MGNLTKEAIRRSEELAGIKPHHPQIELEFSRYKQDCRKRALDLAHQQWDRQFAEFSKHTTDKNEVMTFNVKEIANDYYNWLISIPEK